MYSIIIPLDAKHGIGICPLQKYPGTAAQPVCQTEWCSGRTQLPVTYTLTTIKLMFYDATKLSNVVNATALGLFSQLL